MQAHPAHTACSQPSHQGTPPTPLPFLLPLPRPRFAQPPFSPFPALPPQRERQGGGEGGSFDHVFELLPLEGPSAEAIRRVRDLTGG